MHAITAHNLQKILYCGMPVRWVTWGMSIFPKTP